MSRGVLSSCTSSPIFERHWRLIQLCTFLHAYKADILMGEIPGQEAAISTVRQIDKITETIRIHKEQCIHLRDRANVLCTALQESLDEEPDNDEMRRAADEMGHILRRIHRRMSEWAVLGRVKGFLKQSDISRDLHMLKKDLEMAGLRFSITSMIEFNRAQDLFRASQARDNAQLSVMIRSMMTNREDIDDIMELKNGEPEAVETIMESVQNELASSGNSEKGRQDQLALQKGLTELRQKTGILPPLANLTGEVKRIGDFPVASGHFADIWQGEWLGEKVALKSLRNVGQLDEATEKKFNKEIGIWRRLQHPHVAKLYGICYFGPFVYMISPWAQNKDAFSYLVANREVDRVKLLAQAADGLAYLHSQSPPIIHGDFRAANILISESGEAQISDFGMARLEELSDAQTSLSLSSTGAVRWQAPELINPDLVGLWTPRPSTATDTWSFGIVSYEFFSLEKPYAHRALDVQVFKDIEQGFRHRRPRGTAETQGLTDAVWRLIEDCWNQDPLDRPVMSHVASRLQTLSTNRAIRRASLKPAPISVTVLSPYAQGLSPLQHPRFGNRSVSLSRLPRDVPTAAPEVPSQLLFAESENYSTWMREAVEGAQGISIPGPSSSLFRAETITIPSDSGSRYSQDPLPSPPVLLSGQGQPSLIPVKLSDASSIYTLSSTTAVKSFPIGSSVNCDKSILWNGTSKMFWSGSVTVPTSPLSQIPSIPSRAATMGSEKPPSIESSVSSETHSSQPPLSPVVPLPTDPAEGVELRTDGAMVIGGTIEGLVYRMVVTGSLESRQMTAPYREAFLTMYMAFTDADKVLDVLINQYNAACTSPSLSAGQRINLGFNVLDIIEDWIKQHRIEEADVLLLDRMKEFVSCIQDPPEIVSRARRLIAEVIDPSLDSIHLGTSGSKSNYTSSSGSFIEVALRQVTHESLAQHLTVIESRLYMAIKPTDIVAWLRKSDGEASKAVIEYQVNQQKLTAWVQKLILKIRGGAQERADKFVYFILAAHCCYTMGNFSAMSAIVFALQSMVIGRLRQTREHVEKRYMKQLSAMTDLVDVTHNFKKYRRAISSNSAPVVPWLHVHLKDINSTYRRYPDKFQGQKSELINFQRYERTLGEIRTAFRFQSRAHQDMDYEPGIINLLQRQLACIEIGPELDSWMEKTSQERLNQEGPVYMCKDEALRMTGFA